MCDWVLNASLKCIPQKKKEIFFRVLFTTQKLLVLTETQRNTTYFIGIFLYVLFQRKHPQPQLEKMTLQFVVCSGRKI